MVWEFRSSLSTAPGTIGCLGSQPHHCFKTMNTVICFLVVALAVVVGVLLWVTETPELRAKRWHKAGMSQRVIADRLGVTRYRVRQYLAA
jgi:hypothetical protein